MTRAQAGRLPGIRRGHGSAATRLRAGLVPATGTAGAATGAGAVRPGARVLVLVPLLAVLALAGCKRADMYKQAVSRVWDRNSFFPDGSTMRHPVAGTVPRDEPNLPVPQPRVITATLLTRGHERFDIFCAPCHGRAGDGQGMIVARGFPQPPDLAGPAMRQAPSQHVYDVIANGQGEMYSYADRVPPPDRWAIAAYIRALQAGRSTAVAELDDADRARLAGQP